MCVFFGVLFGCPKGSKRVPKMVQNRSKRGSETVLGKGYQKSFKTQTFFSGFEVAAGPVRNAPERSWHASGPSLSAFRGSPSTPEMLCGLRLQGPLLMHPAVALGSALTARGPSGGPFRARPGAHWAGPLGPPWVGPFGPKSSSRILTSSFFIVKRRRGKTIGRF